MTEEQLTKALKDLDLNGDGVVDLSEFNRWYFTGMKPYNGSTRTMLRIGNKTKALKDVMIAEAMNCLLGQELKVKTSKMSFGFNAPEEPASKIDVGIMFGGHRNGAQTNDLRSKYNDAIIAAKETERFVNGWRKNGYSVTFGEITIKVEEGTAQPNVDKINSMLNMIKEMAVDDESMYFDPKATAVDDSHIAIGLKFHMKNKAGALPADVAAKLAHIEQEIGYSISLGTSLDDVMNGDEPLMKCLSKGFRISHTHTLVSNMKKVFLELMKDQDSEKVQGTLSMMMMFAPATMLSVNGNIDIEFDDMEEIQDHHMLASLMVSFN